MSPKFDSLNGSALTRKIDVVRLDWNPFKMPYVGITLEIGEALRLLKLDDNLVKTFYDTEPIDNYLQDSGFSMRFEYIDKGVCVLGIPLEGERRYWPAMLGIETGLAKILELAKKFREEVKHLKIDMSKVQIAQMEAESIEMENPDPFLILAP